MQSFLAGVSASVVGVIAVVSLELVPDALVDGLSIAIAAISFILIVLVKRDVALVAIGALVAGVLYATFQALT
jgi:hypothetical protein